MEYGLSKTIDKNDERQALWKQQRKERGFDSTELWSLDYTMARFIHPRLVAFAEETPGHPGSVKNAKKWKNILSKMVRAFELILLDEMGYTDVEEKEIEKGMKLFMKHYFSLWT